MPTYEFNCRRGHHFERILKVSDYRVEQVCECGADSRRIISIPRLVTAQPNVHYDSPIDGRPITSMAQRRDDLARSGCREYDPEMRKDADRFAKESEAKLDKQVDATVEAMFEKMPLRKKESLERELTAGADASIERRTV